MDLDVEVLKPLDIWTYLSPCVLSHENYEHSYIVHRMSTPNVINAVMASQPKHPFFKVLQDNLEGFRNKYYDKVLQATGPFFVDDVYHIFQKFVANNKSSSNPENEITIIDPKYWFPIYDPTQNVTLVNRCELVISQYSKDLTIYSPSINRIVDNICKELHGNNYSNKPGNDSYLVHHWVHTYAQKKEFKTQNISSVFTVAPNLIHVSKRLNLECVRKPM